MLRPASCDEPFEIDEKGDSDGGVAETISLLRLLYSGITLTWKHAKHICFYLHFYKVPVAFASGRVLRRRGSVASA
jgi:hypothetical protein